MKTRLFSTLLASSLVACSPNDTETTPTRVSLAVPAADAASPSGRWQSLRIWWDFLFNKPAGTAPGQALPVQALTQAQLLAAPDGSLYRLGHSTLLFKLRGKFWLTDPVFSERSSPVQWFGPQRFHTPPIRIDELPPIEAVILSHDHYDHLDHASILALRDKTAHFIAPRGVGDILVDWGVDPAKVQQLNWWQATDVAGVHLVATPTQHFSGRTLWDRNRTLWSSWVILDGEHRIFFGGDSGYFDGFKTIGERYGPFDVTLLEAGAYDTRWTAIHMLPEQTVQAHQDLRGRWLLPIHNGTFDLAFHAWQQPFERVLTAAAAQGVNLSTPVMGERIDLAHIRSGRAWWRDEDPRNAL